MEDWIVYTTANEFTTDQHFCQWVRSGQYNQPGDPYTVRLQQHPHLLPLAQTAADYLLATGLAEVPLTDSEIDQLVTNTWQAISRQQTATGPIRPLWPTSPTIIWRVAASLLLLSGLAWWAVRYLQATDSMIRSATGVQATRAYPTKSRESAWIRLTNRQRTQQLISLPDGSTVWLAPNSTLRRPVSFDVRKREVELVGEAFFEVAKNVNQPFFVKTHTLVTRVVGTSFLVQAFEQQSQATVQVRTGQVQVYSTKSLIDPKQADKSVLLRPNQQVTMQTTDAPLVAGTVTRPGELAKRLNQQVFDFNDAPVSAVMTALATTYGVQIDYDAQAFRNCRITSSFTDEPLTEKLSILAEIIGTDSRYEIEGNRIRFSGQGCR